MSQDGIGGPPDPPKRKLAPIAYILAGVGMLIGASFSMAVRWDVYLAEHNAQTISEWFMSASIHKKLLVIGIAFVNAFIWGALFAHLVWAKNGSPVFWLIILATTIAGLVAGGIFGNYYFGQ